MVKPHTIQKNRIYDFLFENMSEEYKLYKKYLCKHEYVSMILDGKLVHKVLYTVLLKCMKLYHK